MNHIFILFIFVLSVVNFVFFNIIVDLVIIIFVLSLIVDVI